MFDWGPGEAAFRAGVQKMKYLVTKISMTMGLGDGILSLIQALAYAHITGRTLHVDWRGGWYGMPLEENLFDRIFDVKGVGYSSELPGAGAVVPPAWNGRLMKTFTERMEEDGFDPSPARFDRKEALRRYSADLGAPSHAEEILITWDHYQFDGLVPHLRESGVIPGSCTKFEAMGHVFEKFIQLKPEPRRYLEEHWESVLAEKEESRMLGVHVRETDESFAVYGAISRKRYFSAIDRFLRRKGGPELIFLATDNQDVQRAFHEYYGEIVRSKQKWFDEPGKPLHMGTASRSNNWANLLDALFEMYALSRCGYLVRRRESSFSRVSEIIGLTPADRVALISRDQTFGDFVQRARKLPRRTLRALRKGTNGLVS